MNLLRALNNTKNTLIPKKVNFMCVMYAGIKRQVLAISKNILKSNMKMLNLFHAMSATPDFIEKLVWNNT
jgi:hypothetical protein